jgi:hypothetical protein
VKLACNCSIIDWPKAGPPARLATDQLGRGNALCGLSRRTRRGCRWHSGFFRFTCTFSALLLFIAALSLACLTFGDGSRSGSALDRIAGVLAATNAWAWALYALAIAVAALTSLKARYEFEGANEECALNTPQRIDSATLGRLEALERRCYVRARLTFPVSIRSGTP